MKSFAAPFLAIVLIALASVILASPPPTTAQSTATEPTSVGQATNLVASSAEQDDGAVRLTWTGAPDAQVHFVVYLKTSDLTALNVGQARMAPFAGTEAVITGLEGGAEYSFIVIGMRWNWVTSFGAVWGTWSDWQTATLQGVTADTGAALPATEPTSVGQATNLAASAAEQDDGAVRLTWTGAPDAQVHFVVYLKTSDLTALNVGQAQMAPFAGTEGVISGLEGGTEYNFIVTGMRWNWVTNFGAVWGTWSNWQRATPQGSGIAMSPDRATLVALYNATGGANWTNRANWLSNTPIGEWHGVTTDASGRVTELVLTENGLTGPIPVELASLTNLRRLSIWENELTGPVPAWLGSMTNLRVLNLGGNELTGPIPAELARLTNLTHLYLWGNQLTGPVPAWLGSLSNLERLVLSRNQLAGEIPPELARLSSLQGLSLWDNQLTGPVPAWLGSLTNLEELRLNDNELTGSIPPQLGNLSNLERLDLDDNQLTGPMPVQLGNLSNLKRLNLNENRLNEIMPGWLGDLSNLEYLNLGGTELTGPIPSELARLSNLTELYLWGNQLTGPIPAELSSLTNLESLNLRRNQLTGPVPAWLGNLGSLERLGLHENSLTGEIPPELARLSGLTWLYLSHNQLTGPIPPELGSLTELTRLYLNANSLTGAIPAELGNLANLEIILLAGNQLTGCIPQALQDVPTNDLSELGLSFCSDKRTIVFGDLTWSSAQLQNRIAQYIVEKGYGYPTDVKLGATLRLFQDLRRGDVDVLMELWLPNQEAAWSAGQAAGEVVSLGQSLGKDWQSAFVIPAYLQERYPELDSVADLKDPQYQRLFATSETGGKARLVSCVLGWSCERANAAQVAGYGLSDHIHIVNPGSLAALNSDLYGAYERREPWLGYQWGTNDPALLLDLVRLEEPAYSDQCWLTTQACAYKDATILIAASIDLPGNASDVAEMLRKWDFDVGTVYREIVRWQAANPDADATDAALWWLNNHADVWSAWVTDEVAASIRAALAAGETPDGWPD